jgi:hypothetical protein
VVEAAWRTRWVSRDLPVQKRERITKAQDSPALGSSDRRPAKSVPVS